jgi:hypothetical protein
MKLILAGVLTSLLHFLHLTTATFPSDGTQASIQAIDTNQAHDGDTITLPAGTFQWSGKITLTHALTIQGQTTVTDPHHKVHSDITKVVDNAPDKLIDLRSNGQTKQRITGISFMVGSAPQKFCGIEINGTTPLRVDHNYFDQLPYSPNIINTNVYNYGVFDHNVSDCNHGVILCYPGRNVDNGDSAWQEPAGFGGPKFFFIEDNWIRHGGDISHGGKICARYNEVHGDLFTDGAVAGVFVDHGTSRSGPGRGGRAYDVYGNTFFTNQPDKWMDGQDSGAGNWHDNNFKGTSGGNWRGIATAWTRSGFNFTDSPFKGSPQWDQLATEADGTHVDGHPPFVFESGTLTAASGGTYTDSSKNWPANEWRGYLVVRDSDGMPSSVNDNTANTIHGFQIGFAENWAAGQTYKIFRVVKAFDGPGAGVSDPIDRAHPGFPNQQVEGIYSYNNVNLDNGQQIDLDIPDFESLVVLPGVHIFNRTQMPGYTPFTYPHPLVSGGGGSPTPNPTPIPAQSPTATIPPATPTPTATLAPTPTATPTGGATPNNIGCPDATLVGCTIDVSWCVGVGDMRGFDIQRSADNAHWTLVNHISDQPWARDWTDTTPLAGTNYYQIRAWNDAGNGNWTGSAKENNPCATLTPTPTAAPTATFTPTATATFTPTPTATATATFTPTPTATFTPTPTATATATATIAPSPTPSPIPSLTPLILHPGDRITIEVEPN